MLVPLKGAFRSLPHRAGDGVGLCPGLLEFNGDQSVEPMLAGSPVAPCAGSGS